MKLGHAQLNVQSGQITVTLSSRYSQVKIRSRSAQSQSTVTLSSRYSQVKLGHAQLNVQSGQSTVTLISRYSQVKVRSRSAQGKLAVSGLFRAAQTRFGRKPLGVPRNVAEIFVRKLAIVSVLYQVPLCLIVFSSYLRLCLLYLCSSRIFTEPPRKWRNKCSPPSKISGPSIFSLDMKHYFSIRPSIHCTGARGGKAA